MIDDLETAFEAVPKDEFLAFERIAAPLHPRADLCAFLLIDKLAPKKGDIIGGAGHDEIWLGADLDALAANATEEDILTLVRCGVRWADDGLAMFV
jgi:hypothetical protein